MDDDQRRRPVPHVRAFGSGGSYLSIPIQTPPAQSSGSAIELAFTNVTEDVRITVSDQYGDHLADGGHDGATRSARFEAVAGGARRAGAVDFFVSYTGADVAWAEWAAFVLRAPVNPVSSP